jgi:hypothetical protein
LLDILTRIGGLTLAFFCESKGWSDGCDLEEASGTLPGRGKAVNTVYTAGVDDRVEAKGY